MNGGAALLAVLSVVGYVLLRHCWHCTKFRWDTIEWQQNVFESTALGIALFGICRIAAPLVHRVQVALGLDPTAVPRYLQHHLELPFAGSVSHVRWQRGLSGYRRADDLAVRWTTDYFPAYLDIMTRLQAGERLQAGPEHFQLVLPLESVTSATFFDDEVYNRHFPKRKAM